MKIVTFNKGKIFKPDKKAEEAWRKRFNIAIIELLERKLKEAEKEYDEEYLVT